MNALLLILASISKAAASLAAIFIGWWSRPFRYVAKMATIEGEKWPAFHTQLSDPYEYTVSLLIGHCILLYLNALMHSK